jgi:hypothetical protein
MWRVSSEVNAFAPTGERRLLTSTIGGLPGEKNKSLILGALRNIVASNVGVENGAGTGAGEAAAAPVAEVVEVGVLTAGVLLGDDMSPRT